MALPNTTPPIKCHGNSVQNAQTQNDDVAITHATPKYFATLWTTDIGDPTKLRNPRDCGNTFRRQRKIHNIILMPTTLQRQNASFVDNLFCGLSPGKKFFRIPELLLFPRNAIFGTPGTRLCSKDPQNGRHQKKQRPNSGSRQTDKHQQIKISFSP